MDPQQNTQPQLLIDGHIAHMFGPQGAEAYHASLLKRESRFIRWHINVSEFPVIPFAAPPPPGLDSNQDDWVIDYATRDMGQVIPQEIWAPRKQSDAQRFVINEQLRAPIFFIDRNGQSLGLPLKAAAAGDCMRLRGANQTALVGSSNHAQIRINVGSISTFVIVI